MRVCRLSHSHVEIGEVMNRIKTHRRQQHDIIIKCYFEFFRFTQTIFDEYHSMLLSIGLRVVQSPRATSLELLRVCFLFASPFFGRFVRFGYNVLMPFFLHIVLLRLVCIAFKTKRLQYLPGIGTEEKRCWRYSLSLTPFTRLHQSGAITTHINIKCFPIPISICHLLLLFRTFDPCSSIK